MSEIVFRESDHTYWLGSERIPGVSDILDAHGLISLFAKNDQAALRGTYVHKACHLLAQRKLDWDSVDERLLGYVKAYDNFLTDTGFEPEELEQEHFHELLRYCGTPDAIGRHRSLGRFLYDIKSGAPARYHALQTAAYGGFFQGQLKRATLFLSAEGRYNLRFHNDRTDWNQFVSCLNVLRLPDSDAHRKYELRLAA